MTLTLLVFTGSSRRYEAELPASGCYRITTVQGFFQLSCRCASATCRLLKFAGSETSSVTPKSGDSSARLPVIDHVFVSELNAKQDGLGELAVCRQQSGHGR